MRAYLVLCVAAALIYTAQADCDVCIDQKCYKKHSLTAFNDWNNFLGINRNTNTLYFDDAGFVEQCSLDTEKCKVTTEMGNFKDIVVDDSTGDVYATINGEELYKLDLEASSKTLLLRTMVWQMFFKEKLYYCQGYKGLGIFVYENGATRTVPGTENYNVYNFAVAKNDDIYFYAGHGIFKLSKGVVTRINLIEKTRVNVDRDGNIVLFDFITRAVYRVTDGEIVEVGAIKDSYSPFLPLYDRDNNLVIKYNTGGYSHLTKETGVRCAVTGSPHIRKIKVTV